MDQVPPLEDKSKIFAEEEYAAQLHDVSTYTVHQNVIAIVKDTIDEALDGLQSVIQNNICPEYELKTACSVVRKFYHEAVEKHSPEILESIQESLFIPHNILLPENEAQKQQYSLIEYEDLVKKNVELKSQVVRNSKLKNALALEAKVLDNVETLESKLSEWENLFKTIRSEMDETKKKIEITNRLFSEARVHSGMSKEDPHSVKKILGQSKKNPYSIKNRIFRRVNEF